MIKVLNRVVLVVTVKAETVRVATTTNNAAEGQGQTAIVIRMAAVNADAKVAENVVMVTDATTKVNAVNKTVRDAKAETATTATGDIVLAQEKHLLPEVNNHL
jgi:hypothetical protein